MSGADRCTEAEPVEAKEKTPPNSLVRAGPSRSRVPDRLTRGRPNPSGRTAVAPPSMGARREGLIDRWLGLADEGGADPSAWWVRGSFRGPRRLLPRRPSHPCDGS